MNKIEKKSGFSRGECFERYGLRHVWLFLGFFFLNLLIILLIVGTVMVMLNKSGYMASRDNERLVKIEKDIEEIKKNR